MKLLNIVYTYNRPNVQYMFWDSLEECTKVKADHTIVIDDGSDPQVRNWLYSFCADKGYELLLKPKNQGYARAWLDGWYFVKKYNPEYVFFLESDYIFRNGFMEECLEVFNALPYIWAINGFSHPDFNDKERIKKWFGDVTIEQFGSDIKSRENIYQPFELETGLGKIGCQYSSHACGTFLLNWKRVLEALDSSKRYSEILIGDFTVPSYTINDLDNLIVRACENGDYGKVINDGMITGGLSWYWDKIVNINGDKSHASAFIDICDYSIAQHVSGDGVNGKGIPEGSTNVLSSTFPESYKDFTRK